MRFLQPTDGLPEGLVVDTRSRSHYEHAHIPGALSVPLGEEVFEEEVLQAAGADMVPVTVYGMDDEGAQRAAMRLEGAGFARVAVLVGGTEAWFHAGRPLSGGQVAPGS